LPDATLSMGRMPFAPDRSINSITVASAVRLRTGTLTREPTWTDASSGSGIS
jgi:hypothetical protein